MNRRSLKDIKQSSVYPTLPNNVVRILLDRAIHLPPDRDFGQLAGHRTRTTPTIEGLRGFQFKKSKQETPKRAFRYSHSQNPAGNRFM